MEIQCFVYIFTKCLVSGQYAVNGYVLLVLLLMYSFFIFSFSNLYGNQNKKDTNRNFTQNSDIFYNKFKLEF